VQQQPSTGRYCHGGKHVGIQVCMCDCVPQEGCFGSAEVCCLHLVRHKCFSTRCQEAAAFLLQSHHIWGATGRRPQASHAATRTQQLPVVHCNKIAEAEAAVSVNEEKWLVMHVQLRLDELRGPPNPWLTVT
jgi:hypothetical protein